MSVDTAEDLAIVEALIKQRREKLDRISVAARPVAVELALERLGL